MFSEKKNLPAIPLIAKLLLSACSHTIHDEMGETKNNIPSFTKEEGANKNLIKYGEPNTGAPFLKTSRS